MSEKRFSVRLRSECDGVVYSFFDGDKPLDVEMIVDLLNEQQSEINMSEKQHDDLVIQLKVTNILLAKIYGTLVSANPNLRYVNQDSLQKEVEVINKIINVFCGDVLDG